jgi:hypothetical protein
VFSRGEPSRSKILAPGLRLPSVAKAAFMQIDFFEEFPSEESLAPARLWQHPSTVYLAAKDLSEFNRYAALLKRIQPDAKPAFWPILPSTYWVSPFTPERDLLDLRDMLAASPALDVLLDLELPVLAGKRSRLITGLPGFFRGKRVIREILGLRHRFLLAVYPASGSVTQRLLFALGIDHPDHESCVMYYSSMMPDWLLEAGRQRPSPQSRKRPAHCRPWMPGPRNLWHRTRPDARSPGKGSRVLPEGGNQPCRSVSPGRSRRRFCSDP